MATANCVEADYCCDGGAEFRQVGVMVPNRLIIEQGLANVVTISAGSGQLKRGTMLGAITASGKYVAAVATATDGSQVPDAILADWIETGTTADPTGATDVQAVIFYTGRYNINSLTIDPSFTVAQIEAAFRTKSMFFETTLG